MVMLHVFLTSMPLQNFAVVSVNHNLRKEGAQDCQFVKDYCNQQGVTFFEVEIQVVPFARQNKLSIETAARQLRYDAIKKIADQHGYSTVCLAHHANDNAETVVMHLIRGGGLRGASGIRRKQGRYFRPLLHLTKKEILQYAEQYAVPFVTDATNDDVAYKRNLVRHQVIPALEQINPNAVSAINCFANISLREDAFLDELANISFVKIVDDSAYIPLKEFQLLHPVLQARALRKVMRALGYHKDVEQRHISDVLKLTATFNGEVAINLPFGLIARRTYDVLCISPQDKQQTLTQLEDLQLPFKVGVFEFGNLKVGILDNPPSDTRFLKIDGDKIPADAVIRTRKTGDRFAKFGSGEKKLKDYFIDAKIPQRLRDSIPIIAHNGTVYAVFGQEISKKVKITDKTKNVLYLAILN